MRTNSSQVLFFPKIIILKFESDTKHRQ